MNEENHLISYGQASGDPEWESDDEIDIVQYEHDDSESDTPLVALESRKTDTDRLPPVKFQRRFHNDIMRNVNLIRNIAVIGNLNSGKTSLVDLLVNSCHELTYAKFTHVHEMEKNRDMTLHTHATTLLVSNSESKSFSLCVLDTPGHVDFLDEVRIGLTAADAAFFVADVCDYVFQPMQDSAMSIACEQCRPVVLVLNKLDRLILDLRLTVKDATARVFYLIEEWKRSVASGGDVLFSSTWYGWSFTFESISRLYTKFAGYDYDRMLEIVKTKEGFCAFAMEPIYKIFSAVLTGSKNTIESLGRSLGAEIDFNLDRDDMLRDVFRQYFETPVGTLVDACVNLPCPSPAPHDLSIQVVKKLLIKDEIWGLGKNLGSEITATSDMVLMLPCCQYSISVDSIPHGAIFLIKTEFDFRKNGWIGEPKRSLAFNDPVIKVGVEALRPHQMPTLESNLDLLEQLWGCLKTSRLQNGEFLIFGPGELYLDCALFDVRHAFAQLEINVSPPVTQFRETIIEQSYAACPTRSYDMKNELTFIAEPLGSNISNELEDISCTKMVDILRSNGWDNLSINSVWEYGTNILVDETLPPGKLNHVKGDICQGYNQAIQRGPLCGEPIYGVQLKIMEAHVPDNKRDSSSAQLIATTRRAAHAALLVASPRLMEPVYKVVFVGILYTGKIVYELLRRRRGRVVKDDHPEPGTLLYVIEGELPVMESFGFEAELRNACRNDVSVSCIFAGWQRVPGDPLDNTQKCGKLQRVADSALARDYMLKTRKRKGLPSEPSLRKVLDENVAELLGVEA